MLVAILSDTHDNVASTQAALALLKPLKPDVYLHAGDLVSPGMLEYFVGLPLHFVFGNNETEHGAIRARAAAAGLGAAGGAVAMHCHETLAELEFDGKRLAMLHGDDGRLLRELVASGKYQYVIHGHTHVRRDERVGETRIINPGALQRTRQKSVALLDVAAEATLSRRPQPPRRSSTKAHPTALWPNRWFSHRPTYRVVGPPAHPRKMIKTTYASRPRSTPAWVWRRRSRWRS